MPLLNRTRNDFPRPERLPDGEVPYIAELGLDLEESKTLNKMIEQYITLNSEYKAIEETLKGTKATKTRLESVGLSAKIQATLRFFGQDKVRFRLGTEEFAVGVAESRSTTISKTKLLELGVDPQVILDATVTTPYTYLSVSPIAPRSED